MNNYITHTTTSGSSQIENLHISAQKLVAKRKEAFIFHVSAFNESLLQCTVHTQYSTQCAVCIKHSPYSLIVGTAQCQWLFCLFAQIYVLVAFVHPALLLVVLRTTNLPTNLRTIREIIHCASRTCTRRRATLFKLPAARIPPPLIQIEIQKELSGWYRMECGWLQTTR